MRYIVDTSVFADFFRGKSIPVFEDLVRKNQVVLSSFVRLELLVGASKSEGVILERTLSGLIHMHDERSAELFSIAEKILTKIRPKGVTVGTVDLLIAAQSHITGCPVYSFDKVFSKIAETKLIAAVR